MGGKFRVRVLREPDFSGIVESGTPQAPPPPSAVFCEPIPAMSAGDAHECLRLLRALSCDFTLCAAGVGIVGGDILFVVAWDDLRLDETSGPPMMSGVSISGASIKTCDPTPRLSRLFFLPVFKMSLLESCRFFSTKGERLLAGLCSLSKYSLLKMRLASCPCVIFPAERASAS